MPSILAIVGGLAGVYLSTFVYAFCRNLYRAKKLGLPYVLIPWDQNHFIWMIISVPLQPTLAKYLPTWLWHRLSMTIYGWEQHEKLRPFEQYAAPQGNDKTMVLVTAGATEIETRDPEFAYEILRRARDFVQPDVIALFVAVFGDNVLSSNGDHWSRQRKIVAPVINERISRSVFDESIRQTESLLADVFDRADGATAETNQLFTMMKKITIHVLSGAGMGAQVSWNNDEIDRPQDGYMMTYMQACKTVVEAASGPIILPFWFLKLYPSFLPGQKLMKDLQHAKQEFPRHTQDLIEKERRRAAIEGGDTKSNVMSQLLQANEGDSKAGKQLSDSEVQGNLFIFTTAGFETTANTLSYALALLCRFPEWQRWIFEEIDQVMPTDAGEDLDYTTIHPKVVRILAVMFEVLRTYPPLIHLAKETVAPQVVTTSSGVYHIPAKCHTYVDVTALHLDGDVWRNVNKTDDDPQISVDAYGNTGTEDEFAFRPSRWVNPPGASQTHFQPPKGAYIPWSTGPRVCPGQKMAQVEFTAIFLTLFRRHRIEPVPLPVGGREETENEISMRLDDLMKDSICVPTLQMRGVYEANEGDGKGLKIRLCRRK